MTRQRAKRWLERRERKLESGCTPLIFDCSTSCIDATRRSGYPSTSPRMSGRVSRGTWSRKSATILHGPLSGRCRKTLFRMLRRPFRGDSLASYIPRLGGHVAPNLNSHALSYLSSHENTSANAGPWLHGRVQSRFEVARRYWLAPYREQLVLGRTSSTPNLTSLRHQITSTRINVLVEMEEILRIPAALRSNQTQVSLGVG